MGEEVEGEEGEEGVELLILAPWTAESQEISQEEEGAGQTYCLATVVR